MAERRLPRLDHLHAARSAAVWLDTFASAHPAEWLVTDSSSVVRQTFYLALDAQRRPCWTDDRVQATRFPSKQGADRFALDRLTTDTHVIRCRSDAAVAVAPHCL